MVFLSEMEIKALCFSNKIKWKQRSPKDIKEIRFVRV